MFIEVVVLLGLCGAELAVALCSLAVRSTGWTTVEPFSLPSVFSLGTVGCPATNWKALSFAFACDVAGTGGLGGAVTFVVSPRVVLFWFLCQLPGLGWTISQHIVASWVVHLRRHKSVYEADIFARITITGRMDMVASLPCFSGPVRRSLWCAKTLAEGKSGGVQC